jgi:hypothetical protein
MGRGRHEVAQQSFADNDLGCPMGACFGMATPKRPFLGEEDPDRDPQEPIPYDRSEEYRQDLGNPLYSLEE